MIGKIAASGLTISTIGLGDANQTSGSQTALDEKALKYLAENSGGLYSFAKDPAALASIYEMYQRGLQSEYAVTYTSPSSLRDGLNRVLSVSLNKQSAGTPAKYNPGGLVPEVGQPASWGTFFLMLGVLVLLLFVPRIIKGGAHPQGDPAGETGQKGRAFGEGEAEGAVIHEEDQVEVEVKCPGNRAFFISVFWR